MRGIDRLAQDGLIYVAGRLFDIDEKIKSETLEAAILAGVTDAAGAMGVSVDRRPTFVPFRDAGQEELVVEDKTRRLFELDCGRLERTVLLASYIDGLAKDEGVCFEIGYAFGVGVPILLIATDFFTTELPSGEDVPFDPLLLHAATVLIRQPQLLVGAGAFLDVLVATRAQVLTDVRSAVRELLRQPSAEQRARQLHRRPSTDVRILVDFGGGVFEWQRILFELLARKVGNQARLHLEPTRRYDVANSTEGARADVDALLSADILVTCSDGDEAAAGTAFLQGVACAVGRTVWMYNSKRTWIRAAGGYRSSRNLMLDYSATRTFRTLDDLAEGLRNL